MALSEYKAKRVFTKTSEPETGPAHKGPRLVFVIQKHAARALHYDFRLELDGVLKSWAVPKGPTLDPSIKRLAMMVEDHPFEYRDFEGVIPEGNYGAGSVIIWDRGFYRHPAATDYKENVRLLTEGLKKGDLKFILEGEKISGEFALVKIRKDEKSWLLLKKKDAYADKSDILNENHSVVSGKTLEEIAESAPGKPSNQKLIDQIRIREALERNDLKQTPVIPMPHAVKPMLASLSKGPFDHADWIFEVKWDGYRALAEVRDNEVALYSRNNIPLGRKFPPVLEALRKLKFEALLDGESVVVDEQGEPDFEALQNYQKTGRGRLVYYVFDLLCIEGHDLTGLPLITRKDILNRILPHSVTVRFSDHVWKEGILFFNVAKEKGIEGVMAKHSQSRYTIGKRSSQWLKLKVRQTQEAVIAGFTKPKGSRKFFGSLALGVYKGNELVYIGQSGGGFSSKLLSEISEALKPLVQEACPFKAEPKSEMPLIWVRPELVCEVTFHGWTDEGVMRQPVFLRMREDKTAEEVRR